MANQLWLACCQNPRNKPWHICIFTAISGSNPLLLPASKRGQNSKLVCTVRTRLEGRAGCCAPAAQAISGSATGWVSTSELLTAAAGPKVFAGTNHLLYILWGVCCGFSLQLVPSRPPLCSAGLAWTSWACRSVQKSSDLLVSQVSCKFCPLSLAFSKGGKMQSSDWQEENRCWVRALCHCLF